MGQIEVNGHTVYVDASASLVGRSGTTATVRFSATAYCPNAWFQSSGVGARCCQNSTDLTGNFTVAGNCYPDTWDGSSRTVTRDVSFSVGYGSGTITGLNIDFREVVDDSYHGIQDTVWCNDVSYSDTYEAPNAPSIGSASMYGDTTNYITWSNNHTAQKPYSSVEVYCSVNGGAYSKIATLSASATSYSHVSVSRGNSYRYKLRAVNGEGSSGYSSESNLIVGTPRVPTIGSATRNSDNKNTITWSNNPTSIEPYSGIEIYRSTNGNSWSLIATVGGSATSYADTSTTIDNSYKYRVRAYNDAGYSSFSGETSTLYNTPASPTSISGARVSGTIAGLTIGNASRTATSTELQYSTDKITWNNASTANERATYMEWDTGGGQFYFRARNARGSLKSDWTAASNLVVTITPPLAPTLVNPSSGIVVSKTQENITFSWQHNPVDGSAQTSAQLQYSTDGGTTWTTLTATTSQELTVGNSFQANAVVTWRVRTKGAASDYGAYSATRTFTVCQVPTLTFVSGYPPLTVEDMPIDYQLSYSDQSGTFTSGAIALIDSNGDTIYTETIGDTLAGQISSSEFIPSNGETYSLVATVQSSSSLSATATTSFTVDFVQPMNGSMSVTNNDDGTVSLTVFYPSSSTQGFADVEYASVVRNGVVIADNLSNGTAIIDKYAPINTDYEYEIVTHADSGAVKSVRVPNRINSPYWFFYWGMGNVAKAKWNPTGNTSIGRPQRVRRRFDGKRFEQSYDGIGVSDVRVLNVSMLDDYQRRQFEKLVYESGHGVYKSGEGDVFEADIEYSRSVSFYQTISKGDISLTITRTEGSAI